MVKRYGVLFCCMLLLVGCGSREKKTSSTQVVSSNYVAEGVAFLKANDVVSAIRSFDQAIKHDPYNIQNYFTLGQVYLRLQNYPRAVDTFSAATRVAPTSAQAYYLLAMSCSLDGKKEAAVRAAQKSAELFAQQKDKEGFLHAAKLLKTLTGQEHKT